MHVPYDNIRHVDLLGPGTVVAQLSSPPQCHESLQVASNNAIIRMTITISQKDVDRFIKTLRIRGMTSRIKLNGMPTKHATERTSISKSPTRLEFESSADGIAASYQSKVKVIEDGVLQASDPGDDILPNLEFYANKSQNQPSLLVKECSSPTDVPSVPAPVTTEETKVNYDGGCNHVSSTSHHQLPSVHEDSQKRATSTPLAPSPPSPPRDADPPPLHSPHASGTSHGCYDRNHVSPAHSAPSGNPHRRLPSDKDVSDAIFGGTDEELSSLSDTDSVFRPFQPPTEFVQSRQTTRGSEISERSSRPLRRLRSQRHRHPHMPPGPTSLVSDFNQAQDPAPEQKLAPMVKGLRVIDSQDPTLDKWLNQGAATTAKRKKILLESEDEVEATNCVPSVSKKSSPTPTANLNPERVSQRMRHSKDATTLENGAASERLDQCDSSTVKEKRALTEGESWSGSH
ncbi:hypothetical protein BC827DRAFT_458673 [Russula dissimulans]|nr:hypothetical protein BC827DRAFT_458673 [Russula dissimulans]